MEPKKSPVSKEAAMASNVFDSFCAATNLKSILGQHRHLCELLRLKPSAFPHFYPKLKSKLCSWRAKALWAKFDKRASHKCYNRGRACPNTKVLIIGAGPCGLRTAIEAQLLGAKVVVVEKRDRISRHNVLHLWPFVIHDLKALNAKKFFGKFCAGAIDHISIRQLQCILLKVALILGVEFHEGVGFEALIPPPEDQSVEKTGWRAKVTPAEHPVSQYEFDVLVGADGKRNTLEGFKRKEFRGKLAIAITANFINRHTEAEARVEEISGVAFIFNQKFFKDLYAETGIDLENIVYYKDETHYFVMTAKKHSLISSGVILNDYPDTVKLLSADNKDQDALMKYARDAAEFSTNYIMRNLEFAVDHYGQPDVAMFDFTSMFAAENASRVVERGGHRLLQMLVGDSLLEPFWPTGSGCARGFLSSMDACWAVRSWAGGQATVLEVLAERESIYRILGQTTPENLQRDYAAYTLDPHTRYPNLNKQSVTPVQVKQLFDTDDPASVMLSLVAAAQDLPKKRRRKDSTSPDSVVTSHACVNARAVYDSSPDSDCVQQSVATLRARLDKLCNDNKTLRRDGTSNALPFPPSAPFEIDKDVCGDALNDSAPELYDRTATLHPPVHVVKSIEKNEDYLNNICNYNSPEFSYPPNLLQTPVNAPVINRGKDEDNRRKICKMNTAELSDVINVAPVDTCEKKESELDGDRRTCKTAQNDNGRNVPDVSPIAQALTSDANRCQLNVLYMNSKTPIPKIITRPVSRDSCLNENEDIFSSEIELTKPMTMQSVRNPCSETNPVPIRRDDSVETKGLLRMDVAPTGYVYKDSHVHPDTLLHWLKKQVALYDRNVVHVENVTSSFKNGLALCAIIHRYRPDLIDFHLLTPDDASGNNQLAFDTLERELGVPPVMTGLEMEQCDVPDKLTMLSYLSQVYDTFRGEIPHVKHPKLEPEPGEGPGENPAMDIHARLRNLKPEHNKASSMVSLLSRLTGHAPRVTPSRKRASVDREGVEVGVTPVAHPRHTPADKKCDSSLRKPRKRRSQDKVGSVEESNNDGRPKYGYIYFFGTLFSVAIITYAVFMKHGRITFVDRTY